MSNVDDRITMLEDLLAKETNARIRAEMDKEILAGVLSKVSFWQLPPTNAFWDTEQSIPIDYGAMYGKDAEREYIQALCSTALEEVLH